ncbi:MAG: GLUG motif-containing protein, partial [Planctomycetota bacterium]
MSKQFFFSILMMSLTCSLSFAYDWSINPGDGSESNPYQISEPNQLIAIGSEPNKLDKNYIIVQDILFDPANDPNHVFTTAVIAPDTDLSQSRYQGPGFSGAFDGGGYVIRNLKISAMGTQNDSLGLFGKLERTARIEHLGVENLQISSWGGSSTVGGLCGENTGRITDCYTTGSINASSYVGGLCGENDGYIYTSYSTVEVTGWSDVGGLCGLNIKSLDNCYALGDVTGNNYYVGGLCGEHWGAARNCYSAGKVESGVSHTVGGLCGRSIGYFRDSY